jgi:hypothetical protein
MEQACPRCGRIDSVAKVSAIVSSGTSYSDQATFSFKPSYSVLDGDFDLSGSYGQASGKTITGLSRTLTMVEERISRESTAMACVMVVLALAGCAVLAIQSTGKGFEGFGFLQWAFWILWVGGSTNGVREYMGERAAVKARNARRRLTHDRLYYCYRDDVVYIPGEPARCAPAAKMNVLLD